MGVPFGKICIRRGGLHQVHGARPLDFADDLAVQLSGNAGRAAGIDLAGVGSKLLEKLRIEIVNLIRLDVVATGAACGGSRGAC